MKSERLRSANGITHHLWIALEPWDHESKEADLTAGSMLGLPRAGVQRNLLRVELV